MNETDIILTQDVDQVRLITLNRPEVMNAYNGALFLALMNAIEQADQDPRVRVIVVTGAGKAFCAGADFREGFAMLSEKAQTFMDGDVARDSGGVMNLAIYNCDTPIIAAVNGAAVGIGATMLLAMDIRIASNQAKFAFPFTRRGIAFDGAASWLLPRMVGLSKAQEWSLTGRLIMADEAHASGYIQILTEPDDVLKTAMTLAQDMAQNCSPESVAVNKRLLREAYDGRGPYAAHIEESKALNLAYKSADCMEGVASFLQKRAPKFQDREG